MEEFLVKQFLYLDIDIVNSIIAQTNNGLINTLSNEQEISESESDSINSTVQADGTIGGKLFGLAKAEIDLSGKLEAIENGVSASVSREIISKTLHDAAFDIAYSNISPKKFKMGEQNSDDYGDYVELTRVFDFVDIEYLDKLFDKDGLIDFLKKTSKEKIETELNAATDGMNREQLRTVSSKIKGEIKKLVDASNKQYDDVHEMIKAFKQLLPYSRMLISSDGYLIPLDDKYFRINPANLGFKYGGEITCVGMITNIIGTDTNPCDDKNIFATLQFTVNEALRAILPTKEENLCVIHPIAVFYE